MPDYFFHNFPETIQNKNILDFIEKLEQISKAECRQIYLLTHPLLQKSDFLKYEYGCFMISSNMKIVFINFNDEMETDFKEYVEVMLDELQYVVKKHNFIPMLGRVKNWTNFYSTLSYSKEIEKKDIKTIIDYHSFDLQKPDNRSLRPRALKYTGIYELMPETMQTYLATCSGSEVGQILKVLSELTSRTGFDSAVNTVNHAIAHQARDADSLESLYRRLYSDVPELPAMTLAPGIPKMIPMQPNLTAYDILLQGKGA
ncbi:MAG: hypothetical protein RBR35_19735, partial [Salinivirgaceae bacterium]|nr:hypothetical protein [Salinivirgaceae bacterium]